MSPKYRTAATKKIINNINSIIPNSKPQHIGAYLALQGEVDIKDWLNGCLHQLYLPVIYMLKQMVNLCLKLDPVVQI